MQKRAVEKTSQKQTVCEESQPDQEQSGEVEVISENAEQLIKPVLTKGADESQHSFTPGEQIIRLLFNQPQTFSQMHILFDREEGAQTQEFFLSWLSEDSKFSGELVHQQNDFVSGRRLRENENSLASLKWFRRL
jgi:hypothetical protein